MARLPSSWLPQTRLRYAKMPGDEVPGQREMGNARRTHQEFFLHTETTSLGEGSNAE